MPLAPAVSPRTPVDLGPARSAAVAARVLGPLVAQGAIVRRPRATAWAERRQTDRAAVALLGELRREHGGAPVVLRLGPRRLVLPLDAGDVAALLAGSPDPFTPATVEKRAALGHFEPDSVLISPIGRRPARRLLNEQALDTSEPVHRDADALLAAVDREADALLAAVARAGVLDWPTFAPGFWRTVRTVVLGGSARDDDRVTDLMWTLRQAADWAYLHPRRPRLRAELADRLHAYVRRAEPGSLIACSRAAGTSRPTRCRRRSTTTGRGSTPSSGCGRRPDAPARGARPGERVGRPGVAAGGCVTDPRHTDETCRPTGVGCGPRARRPPGHVPGGRSTADDGRLRAAARRVRPSRALRGDRRPRGPRSVTHRNSPGGPPMNTSIARRRTTRTLSVAAAAVATVSLLAACASAEGGTSAGSASDDTTTAASETKEVQVIDQTNLLLATAQETLEARGLEVQVADASGQGRPIDDPTQWVVVTQDPTSGAVEQGTEVTLTVRMTTDPVG